MLSKEEKFYNKLIKEKEKFLPSWFLNMDFMEKFELLKAHFIITDECFGFNDYYIHQALLYKLNYFKKEKYISYPVQTGVIQRNLPNNFISQTELLRLFEPGEMFIEQCKIIKEKIDTFFDRRKSLYNFPKKLKQEKNENIDHDKLQEDAQKLIKELENQEKNREKYRGKIKTTVIKDQNVFLDIIEEYLFKLNTDSLKLEALHNIIKYCKIKVNELQQKSIF